MHFFLKETEQCSFCNETKETQTHLFFSCNIVKNIWIALKTFLFDQFNIDFPNVEREIILGCDSERCVPAVNSIIMFIKYYIYRCKIQNANPSVENAIVYLKEQAKQEINIAKYCSYKEKQKIIEKWNFLSLTRRPQLCGIVFQLPFVMLNPWRPSKNS